MAAPNTEYKWADTQTDPSQITEHYDSHPNSYDNNGWDLSSPIGPSGKIMNGWMKSVGKWIGYLLDRFKIVNLGSVGVQSVPNDTGIYRFTYTSDGTEALAMVTGDMMVIFNENAPSDPNATVYFWGGSSWSLHGKIDKGLLKYNNSGDPTDGINGDDIGITPKRVWQYVNYMFGPNTTSVPVITNETNCDVVDVKSWRYSGREEFVFKVEATNAVGIINFEAKMPIGIDVSDYFLATHSAMGRISHCIIERIPSTDKIQILIGLDSGVNFGVGDRITIKLTQYT